MGADVLGATGQVVHGGIAHADHAHTALGPFIVEVHQLIGDLEIHGHAQVHGGLVDPVFDLKLVDGDGLE